MEDPTHECPSYLVYAVINAMKFVVVAFALVLMHVIMFVI